MNMSYKHDAEYSNIVGVRVLLLAGPSGPGIRVLHDELTRWGDEAVSHVKGLNAKVEVLYRFGDTEGAVLAKAHVANLKAEGIDANACPV